MPLKFEDIDFIIIGAGKSASTWLQTQLQADPAVYMPGPELHYFSREYSRGDDWYLSQFSDEGAGKTVGEKSNSYLYDPEGAARIHRVLPKAKLIAQLRHPVDRAYSHYCMLYRRGDVGSDIASYLDPSKGEDPRILGAGHYARHLQKYIDQFGRDQLLITFYEGVKGDPEQQMLTVRSFLGLPERPLAECSRGKAKDKTVAVVPGQLRKRFAWAKPLVSPLRGTAAFEAVRGSIASEVKYPPLSDDLRMRLHEYYDPSIEVLENMSGQSLSHWRGQMVNVE
tara:strand:+ start:62833 stop:63678 length:846 start_codon:yes stop_codon:yes gene_type:complete